MAAAQARADQQDSETRDLVATRVAEAQARSEALLAAAEAEADVAPREGRAGGPGRPRGRRPPTPTSCGRRPSRSWPTPGPGPRSSLAAAQDEAQRELAAAAEQTTWTQQTVRSLLATADLEADRIRQLGHREAGDRVRRARLGLGDVAGRLRQKLDDGDRGRPAGGRVSPPGRRRGAGAGRADAAAGPRQPASADAARIREDAEAAAAQAEERARHRLDEAEHGARTLREQVAAESSPSSAPPTTSCAVPAPRAPPSSPTPGPRPTSCARRRAVSLEDARAEIALLARRRDGITAELGQLSGVIQALAVPHPHPPTTQEPEP